LLLLLLLVRSRCGVDVWPGRQREPAARGVRLRRCEQNKFYKHNCFEDARRHAIHWSIHPLNHAIQCVLSNPASQ
jgi:hypothetical protein